ncbi:hypothetical protein D3C72_792400 [compost metagenome]
MDEEVALLDEEGLAGHLEAADVEPAELVVAQLGLVQVDADGPGAEQILHLTALAGAAHLALEGLAVLAGHHERLEDRRLAALEVGGFRLDGHLHGLAVFQLELDALLLAGLDAEQQPAILVEGRLDGLAVHRHPEDVVLVVADLDAALIDGLQQHGGLVDQVLHLRRVERGDRAAGQRGRQGRGERQRDKQGVRALHQGNELLSSNGPDNDGPSFNDLLPLLVCKI